jgi:hypothetical protein
MARSPSKANAASRGRRPVRGAKKAGSRSRRSGQSAEREQLAAKVAQALPDWELCEPAPHSEEAVAEDQDMGADVEQGPSIEELKRKFLGEDAADSGPEEFATDDRKPVRIRPKKGGAAKTADVSPDGKVTIVQG